MKTLWLRLQHFFARNRCQECGKPLIWQEAFIDDIYGAFCNEDERNEYWRNIQF